MVMLLKVTFSCAMTRSFAFCALLLGASCGEPARDVLLVRPSSLAAMWPLVAPFIPDNGDTTSGTGGGGGRPSRLVDMLRPRVGVFAFDAVGVPPPLPFDGGAGGGCEGRGLLRDGVPGP